MNRVHVGHGAECVVDNDARAMAIQGSVENWTAYKEVSLWLREMSEREEVCIFQRRRLRIGDKENPCDIRTKRHIFVNGDLDILLEMLRAAGPHYSRRYLLGADWTSKRRFVDTPIANRDYDEFTFRRYRVIFPNSISGLGLYGAFE
jgi:hypothetical protein